MPHDNLNIDLVFPIRDEVSAWLMCLKAELFYDAGMIKDNESNAVIERVAAAIDQFEKSGSGAITHATELRRRRQEGLNICLAPTA